jgi:hypothetical protein
LRFFTSSRKFLKQPEKAIPIKKTAKKAVYVSNPAERFERHSNLDNG